MAGVDSDSGQLDGSHWVYDREKQWTSLPLHGDGQVHVNGVNPTVSQPSDSNVDWCRPGIEWHTPKPFRTVNGTSPGAVEEYRFRGLFAVEDNAVFFSDFCKPGTKPWALFDVSLASNAAGMSETLDGLPAPWKTNNSIVTDLDVWSPLVSTKSDLLLPGHPNCAMPMLQFTLWEMGWKELLRLNMADREVFRKALESHLG